MKYQAILLMSAALVSVGASAEDNKPKKGTDATFEALDKDADGRLSREELAAHEGLSGSFSTLDGDSDGYVTKKEFRAKVRPAPKPQL